MITHSLQTDLVDPTLKQIVRTSFLYRISHNDRDCELAKDDQPSDGVSWGSGGISAGGFEIVMREQVIAPAAIRVSWKKEILPQDAANFFQPT